VLLRRSRGCAVTVVRSRSRSIKITDFWVSREKLR